MLVFALALHALAAVVWVGGMFFAHMVLRPTLLEIEPPLRLKIWAGVFRRFFRFVWLSIIALLLSGYGVVYGGYGGFAGVGVHIHIMQLTGLTMIGLYSLIYFRFFPRFLSLVAAENWAEAAAWQGKIRKIVGINLILGIITTILGGTGALWG